MGKPSRRLSVSKRAIAKALEEKQLAEEDNVIALPKPAVRSCLRCSKTLRSKSAGNRICAQCHKQYLPRYHVGHV